METKKINIVWRDIDSVVLKFIHYSSNGEKSYLGVTFNNGFSYIFSNVGLDEVIGLMNSLSPGSYFSNNIKTKYPYKNVGRSEEDSPLEKIGVDISGVWRKPNVQ